MDFDEQYDKIYHDCYFKLYHQQMAEDVTQETFLHFLENSNYCERGQKIRYLYAIVHNLYVDTYRAKQAELLKDELLIEDKEDEILIGIALKEAVSQLTKEEQETKNDCRGLPG